MDGQVASLHSVHIPRSTGRRSHLLPTVLPHARTSYKPLPQSRIVIQPPCYWKYIIVITHLSRMVSSLIKWTSSFPFLGLSVGIYHFIQIVIEHYVSKQFKPQSDAAFCGV